jgi:hypothetical protein
LTEQSYYLKLGERRIRMMRTVETERGDQMLIFHLHGGGFHITKHPLANPHMVNKKTGFRKELDVAALQSIDWDAMAPESQRAFESLFYWPAHRADLIAFPGPPGKSWVQGFEEVFKGPDIDIVECVRLVLGNGTLYKVGYRERRAFFATELGRGSLLWDKKEGRVGFWTGSPFPDRPLFGFRPEDGAFALPMPRPAQEWKAAMDFEMEAGAEEFFTQRENQFDELFEEIAPELKEFVRRFRIIRWKQGPPGGEH